MFAQSGKEVGYKIDIVQQLNPPTFYLSLLMPDGVIAQSYRLNGNTIILDSSITKSGFENFTEEKMDIYNANVEET